MILFKKLHSWIKILDTSYDPLYGIEIIVYMFRSWDLFCYIVKLKWFNDFINNLMVIDADFGRENYGSIFHNYDWERESWNHYDFKKKWFSDGLFQVNIFWNHIFRKLKVSWSLFKKTLDFRFTRRNKYGKKNYIYKFWE